MAYQYSNRLWSLAKFRKATRTIGQLDPNLFIVSELLTNFPPTTTYNDLIYGEKNYNKLDSIFKKIDGLRRSDTTPIRFGDRQIVFEKETKVGESYFVNKPQPILGQNPNLEINTSDKIFTWGYTSNSRPDIKDIQSEPNYIANVPYTHILRGTNLKVVISVMAKEDITNALNFNLNLYRQVVDNEGNVEKTVVGNLGTVAVDGNIERGQTVSIRQGHFAQTFVSLSIDNINVGGLLEGGRPEGGNTSLNIGSFTNSDFLMDDPIEFINSSKFTGSDFTVSGNSASSVSYFISLENVDEVVSNGIGVISVNTLFETPGGGTRPWCELPLFAGHVYNGAGSSFGHYVFGCQAWLSPE